LIRRAQADACANKGPDKLNQLEARIKYTDDKINQLVFDLYGLSEEERGIVEGKD